jgi:hypothetical protein
VAHGVLGSFALLGNGPTATGDVCKGSGDDRAPPRLAASLRWGDAMSRTVVASPLKGEPGPEGPPLQHSLAADRESICAGGEGLLQMRTLFLAPTGKVRETAVRADPKRVLSSGGWDSVEACSTTFVPVQPAADRPTEANGSDPAAESGLVAEVSGSVHLKFRLNEFQPSAETERVAAAN